MHDIMPYLALLVVILTGVGIVKKLQVNILLLFAGIALNLIAILGGVTDLMPKGAHSTGFIGFDLFGLLSALSRHQAATTGFIILVAGGFAAYMDQIGATDKLVAVCLKPLQRLRNPYLIMGAVFILGNFLGLVVTSAAGMAMLLAVSVYPLLIGIGISGVAAAAVIGSVLVISYAPSSAIAVLSAHTAGVDPMTYLIQYQLPVAVPAILVTAVVHVIVQNYLDKRDKATGSLLSIDPKVVEEKTRTSPATTRSFRLCRSSFSLSSTRWSIRPWCSMSRSRCLSAGYSGFSSTCCTAGTSRRASRTASRCLRAWAT